MKTWQNSEQVRSEKSHLFIFKKCQAIRNETVACLINGCNVPENLILSFSKDLTTETVVYIQREHKRFLSLHDNAM